LPGRPERRPFSARGDRGGTCGVRVALAFDALDRRGQVALEDRLGALDVAAQRTHAFVGLRDEAAIGRAIDDAIDVLPLAVAGEFNEAMKRLHTPKDQ